MSQDKLQKLNNFFDKYVDLMLIKDIELIKAKNDEFKFSYPYILIASSCIDLFGGIEKGFKENGRSNSKSRFVWFVREWMSKINILYGEESLSFLIYDSWRCGISHQANLKRGFETSSYMFHRDEHLHYINDRGRVFIHSIQFADDMISAQKLYRDSIKNKSSDHSYIDSLHKNLLDMIGDSTPKKEDEFNKFIEVLRQKNMTINSSSPVPTTNSTSTNSSPSCNPPITRLPDESMYSAAPDEENLE